MRKVAITGGLSCGKSSVCRFFQEHGAYVISADTIVHQLLSSDPSLIQQVVDLLGSDIIDSNGINRALVAKKVFNNPKLLEALEHLLHPAVLQELLIQMKHTENTHLASFFVAEIPLLFEIGAEVFFDFTVAVIASPEICRKRFQIITGTNNETFDSRAARQLSMEAKALKADFVIENNGTLEDLKQSIDTLWKQLCDTRSS